MRQHASTASRLPCGGFAGLDPVSVLARGRNQTEMPVELSDRLAYLTRKMVAAYLWRAPIRPPDALADVLGHEDLSGDRPYTHMSESEVLAQNAAVIEAARSRSAAL